MQLNENIRIGFTFLRGGGGPSTFMRRLRSSIVKQKIAEVSLIIDPSTDINIFSKISPQKHTLSVIIRTFKGSVTKWCRENRYDYFKWQRNYFDRIIRNEKELNNLDMERNSTFGLFHFKKS